MMDSTRRVAKLEALLARVQSRATTGGGRPVDVAVALAPSRAAAPAPAPVGLRPVGAVQAKPAPAPTPAPSPRPASVVNKTPSVPPAQDDAPTMIHSVDVHAIDSLAASADALTTRNAEPAPVPAAAPAPAPAPAPEPAPAAAAGPTFRRASALGALSKKATLIGTAPPANWPPRQSDAPPAGAVAPSTPPPDLEPSVVLGGDDAAPPEPETSAGDVDALLGNDEEAAAPAAVEEAPKPTAVAVVAREATPAPLVRRAQDDVEPVVEKTAKPARRASTLIALIVIWILVLAVFWVVYRGSFR